MRLNRVAVVVAFGVLLLIASAEVATAQGTKADAEIEDPEGNTVGNAQITEDSGGAEITVEAEGLEPGEHGVHVHETGECSLPKFESAAKHFNPGEAKHGLKNWEDPHAGDLPNLEADEDGTATYEATTDRVSLSGGARRTCSMSTAARSLSTLKRTSRRPTRPGIARIESPAASSKRLLPPRRDRRLPVAPALSR